MKVLFNGTTLVKGGALQVAVSFLQQVLQDDAGINWSFALSQELLKELGQDERLISRSNLFVFEQSPARSISSRRRLSCIEKDGCFDVVFTMFGPSYVRFQSRHICGVADGWVTHSSWLAIRKLGSIADISRVLIHIAYKLMWYRRADAWVVEADNAKKGLIKRLKLNPGLISIVPNTCSSIYRERHVQAKVPCDGETIRILTLSAYYKHKNLEILPEVARHISCIDDQLDFEFVVTLPDDSSGLKIIIEKAKSLGVERYINNIGPIPVNKGPEIYGSCHMAFLPSLLETFSANYPEAMAMKRPIVTTNLDFARNVCKDAALYYEAMDAEAAAEQIVSLIRDHKLWEQQVSKGETVLQGLPTPEDKYRKYIEILKNHSVK